MQLFKNKRMIGGLVLFAVAALGYYVWSTGSSQALLSNTGEGASPLSQEILATLASLTTIKLDDSIFSDPVFVSLTDFGVTIPEEPIGRRNPFAPIGGASAPPRP